MFGIFLKFFDFFLFCTPLVDFYTWLLLRILVGQEYKPWELPLGVREISFFTSSGMTRSKANEVIGVLDAFKKSR